MMGSIMGKMFRAVVQTTRGVRSSSTSRTEGVQVLLAVLVLSVSSCSSEVPQMAVPGDPHRGRELIQEYGCGSCHEIPGIDSAQGLVGPPLDKIARRAYLAGVLPNNAGNMALWLASPQTVAPASAMPDTGVTQADADDMAAYLYTLD